MASDEVLSVDNITVVDMWQTGSQRKDAMVGQKAERGQASLALSKTNLGPTKNHFNPF